jgi:two-component system, chemotaxis family, CheB/CheR fusion protein
VKGRCILGIIVGICRPAHSHRTTLVPTRMPNPTDQGQDRPPIVGIGASAGGIEALRRFFKTIPDDLGAAYVVIVHLAPDHDSELPSILARETRMPVTQVGDHDQESLQPNHVYVIAPDRKLQVTDSAVGASRFEQPRGQRSAIDLFFRSLAEVPGDIYAVVLSGGGSDGAQGARAIKAAGGLVLVQAPAEAAHDSMPLAVIATGAADLVLPVQALAEQLVELLRHRDSIERLRRPADSGEGVGERDEAALQRVLDLLRRRTGHDFSKYKRATVLRRLTRRMQLNHKREIAQYLAYLQENVEEIQALFNDLLITVTTFFRDPDAWAALQQQVIGPLIEQAHPDAPIRCWVPGCATGEEAYTLAILFSEEIERRQVQHDFTIFASDINEQALAVARDGLYPMAIGHDVSEARRQRWFRPTDDHYRVVPELRERVIFTTHSLQRDPPFSRLHLISCRNLLIYLDQELQEQVMALFRYACRDDGYLFLGSSETASEQYFRPLDKSHRLYQAIAHAEGRRRKLPDLPITLPQSLPMRERRRLPSERDALGEVHRVMLEEHAPPSVLVDANWEVLHLSESVGRFLQPQGGLVSHAILELVRTELRGEVGVALRHAFEAGEQWLSEFVAVHFNGTPRRVAVLVQPHADDGQRPTRALLLFLEAGTVSADGHEPALAEAGSARERALLERLHQADQHIKSLRAEHHAAEEDLRAVNEELQSLNEEYRSTTEELETSKEELQSINEELQTVNFELKAKLEEISRAHDDLENLMAATDIATLFLDRSLSIKRFTPQVAGIFKVKSTDIGRPIGDITHGLAYDELERDVRSVLANLAPLEREITAHDGRAFSVRLRPYRTAGDKIDGVVITLIDVTRLKRAESVLRRSEERFRALVDASAQTVWTTDAAGAVAEDAPSWRTFTGQAEAQRRGWGWLEAVHADDRADAEQHWRQALASRIPLDHELRLWHAASGSYRWTSMRAVPLRSSDGSVRGWVGMNSDISERKAAEEALHELDRRKDEFLAMLGHELRNPLAAIRNSVAACQLADEAGSAGMAGIAPEAAMRRAMRVVDRQSRHMARLIADLLDVTRITRNKLTLHRQPTDAVACLRELSTTLKPQIDAAGLRLAIESPASPLLLDADPERLTQMVENLLRNAITYTDAGGSIRITAERQGEQGLIRVEDTGIGIDAEQIGILFEPYRQLHKDRHHSGLGLGLALVKRLAELHGGSVQAHSEGAGKGSSFELRLPLAGPSQPVEPAAPSTRRPPRRRILVVDDEADVADMFARMLEQLDQDVTVVYSGADAIQAALARPPQIVFLDLAMPAMPGTEVARRLREHFPPAALTLIAVSGHDSKAAIAQGGAFDRHLLKPVAPETLIGLLNELPVPPA